MLNQINCLKTGGLALGVLGVIMAIINVIYCIAIHENFADIKHNFVMASVVGEAPEHIIRLAYVINSIFDLLFSALLIAGILRVNKINEYSIYHTYKCDVN